MAQCSTTGSRLRHELSVWEAIGLSLALMALSMAANINPQGTAGSVGRAVPLAFALATVGVLLIAYTFVRLCQRFNHAGSVYGSSARRWGDWDGGEVGHPEVAVPAFQGIGDPVAGLVGVVVFGDVYPLGEGETVGVAPSLVQLIPGDPGVLDERRGGGRSGADEAVRVPDGAGQRVGVAAPEPDRRMRLLDRLGFRCRPAASQWRRWPK
jgi:hypothetical protein